MKNQYNFTTNEIESSSIIDRLNELKITEFYLHDEKISKNKNTIIKIIRQLENSSQNIFVSFLVDAKIIDREFINLAENSFVSFDIPICFEEKNGKILFDKKLYASKSRLLNEKNINFGFQIDYATTKNKGDSLKLFLDRLDFSFLQYPNHIDFPQTENNDIQTFVTEFFSAKNIRYARDIAFATRTFYSSGRAVSWFLSVLKPLKIHPSKFLSDFAEWQHCNNCDFKSGFVPENENHKEIEKMQILFLQEKYEEKKRYDLIKLVKDIVKINGAFSRLVGENEESTLKLSYNPEDLLGPESLDLESFVENVCMENCEIKIFFSGEEPVFKNLN